ncbi:chemotaxis protein CheX [Bosea caraganae]|uniref:Chemotaxis protein CheX n=1 Tax=Bosea caraganae TaxID=2763117 RepID=A0A370L358_9HYPH|nr:chemotaxis protein CheX [Bosea caraganae]RDJ20856.1 chemotaxis protein CheX [Bosea caraganae]RDJ22611.1 chemotaxis protein CheX [Bosea caraganae]
MTGVNISLDELERDALTEVVNIGVSRAASSLRKMVGRQVLLSVPSVEIVTQAAAAALIGQRESEDLVAVKQEFEGAFSGRALLIFPETKSRELARAVMGDEASAEQVSELESEALAETGNVILNNCLGTMANMLKQSLKMSLPEIIRGTGERLFSETGEPDEGALVLFLYINFSVQDRNIRGYIAMLMDLPSMAALKVLIADFIDRVTEDV